jgi:hypothetical protein
MLGHAYCPARIPRFSELSGVKEVDYDELPVSTVFLDEVVESKSHNSGVKFDQCPGFPAKVLVERHLHHYIAEKSLKRVVLRHYIPVPENGKNSVLEIDNYASSLSLSKFYSVDSLEQALCLF